MMYSAGNIISNGFLMPMYLNGYFNSVFTRENISSLPVLDATFEAAKSHYLWQLIVTPEIITRKIKITNHLGWTAFHQNYSTKLNNRTN